jgi:hypothetical protein
MQIRKFAMIFFLTLFVKGGYAEELNLSASVNKNVISDRDILIYSVNIEGTRDFPDVPPPESPDFVMISGPSQSSSIQIINGQMSASKTISWQIAPTRTGKLTIPPVSVKYRGKTYTTEAICVTVTTAASGQSRSQTRPSTPAQTPQPPTSKNADSQDEEVFLKASAPQTTVYIGEQILVSFDLYFKNVRTYGRKKLPEAQGFWIEEIPAPGQPVITNTTVNGVSYRKATVQQLALFATTTGELTIDPMVVDCEVVQVNQRRRSMFDDFFNDSFFNDPLFQSSKVVTVQSQPLKIRVKSLPENGQPASFTGAVGQFVIESSLDTLQTQQDQALTLRYKISGTGNINALKLPPLNLPNSVEIFDPKIDKKIDNSHGTVRGSITYEYVIIPRRPGQFNIPALAFSYFDPRAESYRTQTARGYNVRVGSNANAQPGSATGLSKEEISLLGQDIRFIMREKPTWRMSDRTVFGEPWFWLLNVFSLLVLCGSVILRWWTDKLETNLAFARRRKAWSKVQGRLKNLQEMLNGNVRMDFYSQLNQALTGYIADRLSLPLAGLGPKEIESALQKRNTNAELVTKVVALLIRLDEIRFLPGMEVAEKPDDLLTTVREILTNLSKVI